MKKTWTLTVGLALLAAAVLISGCCPLPGAFVPSGPVIRGSGQLTTETRAVSGFDQVVVGGLYDLTITQGDQEGLTIEAEDNIMRYLESRVRNRTLYLGLQGVHINQTKRVRYTLQVRNLEGLEASGLGSIEMASLRAERPRFELSGSTSLTLGTLEADRLTLQGSGLSNVSVTGKVTEQTVEISGSGNYQADRLASLRARVELSGASRATVWVQDSLDVQASGASTVSYYGDPRVRQETSGVSTVRHLGDEP